MSGITPQELERDVVQIVTDVARFVIVAGALLIALAVVRLQRLRAEGRQTGPVHPALVLSYLSFLAITVIRRAQNLGQPADFYLYLSAIAIALGAIGIGSRLRFHLWRPGSGDGGPPRHDRPLPADGNALYAARVSAAATARTAPATGEAYARRMARLTSAAVTAWTNPHGTVPGRHSLRVSRLRATWPQLAESLDLLAEAAAHAPGNVQPYTCDRCGAHVDAVHADVDARTATHRYRFTPCGCGVDRGAALHAYEHGVTPVITPINGATLAQAERARQRDEEGYDVDHDLQHGHGDLAWAAYCYIDAASPDTVSRPDDDPPAVWPWPRSAWRPGKTAMRHLVQATALLIAELDRRLALGETPDGKAPGE